jgi:5-methylcytosine-specific restriction endonuclease McrA
LEQMYPTCAVCDERHGLEIDHIIPVAEGGPTTKDNLTRLCRWHHMLKTIHGYRLVGGLGNWSLIGPDPPI